MGHTHKCVLNQFSYFESLNILNFLTINSALNVVFQFFLPSIIIIVSLPVKHISASSIISVIDHPQTQWQHNELDILISDALWLVFKLWLSVEAASGGAERAAWRQSRVQKSECVLVTELKLALPLALYTHPFSLVLSLCLTEWLSLSSSVTRSPQPIKCGELVVNFSLQHTNTLNSLALVGLWLCCYYSSHVSSMFLMSFFSPFACYLHLVLSPKPALKNNKLRLDVFFFL